MSGTNEQCGPKVYRLASDLAELELQRLRKQVHDLEQSSLNGQSKEPSDATDQQVCECCCEPSDQIQLLDCNRIWNCGHFDSAGHIYAEVNDALGT
jgi:hypothetical protein